MRALRALSRMESDEASNRLLCATHDLAPPFRQPYGRRRRVFLLRTTLRENRALHGCLRSRVEATRATLHSNLASSNPKNRPEDTVRWLSVAQYKGLRSS